MKNPLLIAFLIHNLIFGVTLTFQGDDLTNPTHWNDADNWDGDAVPTIEDDVIIDGTAATNCVLQDSSVCKSLTITDAFTYNFDMNTQSINVAGNISFDATDLNDTMKLSGRIYHTADGHIAFESGPYYPFFNSNAAKPSIITPVNDSIINNYGNTLHLQDFYAAYSSKITVMVGNGFGIWGIQDIGAGELKLDHPMHYNFEMNKDNTTTFNVACTVSTHTGAIPTLTFELNDSSHKDIPNLPRCAAALYFQNEQDIDTGFFDMSGDTLPGYQISIENEGNADMTVNMSAATFLKPANFLWCGADNKDMTVNFAGRCSTSTLQDIDLAYYNGDTATYNLGSTIFSLTRNLRNDIHNIINPGTSTFNFFGASGTGMVKLLSPARQHLYNVVHSGAAIFTDSCGMILDGSFTGTGNGARNFYYGIQCAGNFDLDGTGAQVFPSDTITMTGTTSRFHVGSTVGTFNPWYSYIRMNTRNAGIIDVDKTATFSGFILGDSDTATISSGATSTLQNSSPLISTINGGSLTINRSLILIASSSTGQRYFHHAGNTPIINGNSNIAIKIGTNNAVDTLYGINYTGTGQIQITENGTRTNVTNILAEDISAGQTLIYTTGASSYSFLARGYGITATTLTLGCQNAGGSFTCDMSSGTHTFTSYVGTTYNSGTSNISWGTGTRNCSGNYTNGSTHTYKDTGTLVLNGTAAQSVTFSGKGIYKLTVNNSGSAIATPVSFADSATILDDLTLTDGPFRANSNGIYIVDDFTHTSGDSTRYQNVYIGGDYTRAAGANKNDTAGQHLQFLEGASHTAALANKTYAKITASGPTAFNDGGTIASLSFGIDGIKVTAESGTTLSIGALSVGGTSDSPDTLWGDGGAFTLITGSDTIMDTGGYLNIGNIILNNPIKNGGILTISDGTLDAGGNDIYCNELNWSTTDSVKGLSNIYILGAFNRDPGADKCDTSGQNIEFLAGRTRTAELGGQVYGTITLNSTTYFKDGATMGKLTCSSEGIKVTLEAGKKFSVDILEIGGDIVRGTDTLVSSSAGAMDTIATSQDTIADPIYIKDQYFTNKLYLDSAANTAGNNRNLISLSFTGATLYKSSINPGDTVQLATGNGLIGGNAILGDSILTLTVIAPDTGYFVCPLKMPAGLYDVILTNDDLDMLILPYVITVKETGFLNKLKRFFLLYLK